MTELEQLSFSPVIGGKELIIEALDGLAYIEEGLVFSSVCKNFTTWQLNVPGEKTSEIKAKLLEMRGEACLAAIFTKISRNLNLMLFSQSQILRFCEKYPSLVFAEGATAFLTKTNSCYYVVIARGSEFSFSADLEPLGSTKIWCGSDYLRFACPF